MGSISVAGYKPKPGCEAALLELGTIIEIFAI